MNNTTKADRQQLTDYAAPRVRMDAEMACTNWHALVDEIMQKFGVSKERAKSATARALRQKRAEIVRNRK